MFVTVFVGLLAEPDVPLASPPDESLRLDLRAYLRSGFIEKDAGDFFEILNDSE